MTLDYPRAARAGLDVTWQLTVSREGGFRKTLVLALGAFPEFDIYEHQAFYPSPDYRDADGRDLILTFVAPPGDTFVSELRRLCTAVEPARSRWHHRSHRRPDEVTSLSYSTWLAP